jgi:hypothetical protein
MARISRTAITLVILVVLSALVGACGGDDLGTISGGSDEVAPAAGTLERDYAGKDVADSDQGMSYGAATQTSQDGDGGSGGGLSPSITEAPAVGPNVIKTADIRLEIDRDGLEAAVRDGIAAAGRFGGFVLSTSMEDDGSGSATVIVRVPAESFERALAELEGLGEVESEQVSGRDVGQEFIDLGARIRNLEAQEVVLLRLMDRSQSVLDTIRVQRELQPVQLEIERLTGRLRYLRDQADMSTISITFMEAGASAAEPKGTIAKAWARAMDLALGMVSAAIVGTGVIIPLGLLVLLGYLVVRTRRPRLSS